MTDLSALSREELATKLDLYVFGMHGIAIEAARRLRLDSDLAARLAKAEARIAELEADGDKRHAKLVEVADKLQAAKARIVSMEAALEGSTARDRLQAQRIRDLESQLAANGKGGEEPIAVGDRVKHLASGVCGVVHENDDGCLHVRTHEARRPMAFWGEDEVTRLPPEPAVRNMTVPIIATNADDEAEVDALMNRKHEEAVAAVRKPPFEWTAEDKARAVPGSVVDVYWRNYDGRCAKETVAGYNPQGLLIRTGGRTTNGAPPLYLCDPQSLITPEPAKPADPEWMPRIGDSVRITRGPFTGKTLTVVNIGVMGAIQVDTKGAGFIWTTAFEPPTEPTVEPAAEGKGVRYGRGCAPDYDGESLADILANPSDWSHVTYQLAEHLSRVLSGVAEIAAELGELAHAMTRPRDISMREAAELVDQLGVKLRGLQ